MTRDFNGERGTENGERFFLKHIEIARVFIIKKNPFAPYIPGGADPGFGPSFFYPFTRSRVYAFGCQRVNA